VAAAVRDLERPEDHSANVEAPCVLSKIPQKFLSTDSHR
jgi:hypothetical protein